MQLKLLLCDMHLLKYNFTIWFLADNCCLLWSDRRSDDRPGRQKFCDNLFLVNWTIHSYILFIQIPSKTLKLKIKKLTNRTLSVSVVLLVSETLLFFCPAKLHLIQKIKKINNYWIQLNLANCWRNEQMCGVGRGCG